MNAAVRAVVRMGIYVGAKVYFIYEVSGPAAGGRVWEVCPWSGRTPRFVRGWGGSRAAHCSFRI